MPEGESEPLDWTPPRKRARRSRSRRWTLRLLVVLTLLGAGYLLLTRSFVTKWIVLARIGALVGGEASAGAVHLDADGTISIDKAVIRAPGVAGEAGAVFSVDHLYARANFWSMVLGRPSIRVLRLDSPVIRLSQSTDDGSLNIASLSLPGSAPDASPKVVPQVSINHGVIEIGEHFTRGEGPVYTALKRIDVSGVVERSPEEKGASVISFRQGGRKHGVSVQGRISREGLSLTMSGMDLDAWPPDAVPTRLREYFTRMGMQGKVSGVTFSYSYVGGVLASMDLANVSVSLPITEQPDRVEGGPAAQSGPGGPGGPKTDLGGTGIGRARWLRLHEVNGTLSLDNDGVRATLNGRVEELPVTVTFRTEGTSVDSPFTATLASTGFQLTENPTILRFAPWVVRKRLHQFSDPTGLVDAEVTVRRRTGAAGAEPAAGSPEAEPPVSVSGLLRFRDASASFTRFPYRFNHMTGDFTFTDSRIDIREIRGVAPSGATIAATGWITPLNDDAAVEIHVNVDKLPIDERLEEGLRHRRKALEAVFSRPRFKELQDKGLIATTAAHAAAQGRLDALVAGGRAESPEADAARAVLARPVFDLGGLASVTVLVTREAGPGDRWHDRIDIAVPHAGLVPEHIPIPLIGDNVRIVKTDDDATVSGGAYRGLRGGRADVSAHIDFAQLDKDGAPFVPEVRVDATAVPVDDLLINAIPPGPPSLGEGRTIPEMLALLRPHGTVDCRAELWLDENEGDAAYTVDVKTGGLDAAPLDPDGAARVRIGGLSGTLALTQHAVRVDLTGEILRVPENAAPLERAGRAAIRSEIVFSDDRRGTPPRLTVRTGVAGQDTGAFVEDVVRVFTPEGAAQIAALREAHRPTGVVDMDTTVTRVGENPVDVTIDASRPKDLEFTFAGGRLKATGETGSVRVVPGREKTPGELTFRDFHAHAWFNGGDDGTIVADGPLKTDGTPIPGSAPLRVSLDGTRFECGLVRAIVGAKAGARAADLFNTANPRGVFGLDATLTPPPAGLPGAGAPAWALHALLKPRSLTLTFPRGDAAASRVEGEIEFTTDSGQARGIVLHADEGWTLAADASFTRPSGTALAMESTFTLDAPAYTPGLDAALPGALHDALSAISLKAPGGVRAEKVKLALTFPAPEAPPAIKTVGRVSIAGASADLGAAVSDADAVVDFSFRSTDDKAPSRLDLYTIADSLRVAGVSMTGARVRGVSGDRGELFFPLISADCHAGRVAGSAALYPRDDGRRDYTADIRLSGVRFASILEDLNAVPAGASKESPGAERSEPRDADESRGLLDAGITLRGIAGDPASRIGRGSVTIGGGRVMSMPLLMPIVRFSNLQLPLDERLDFALADFYVGGSVISVEQASIQSKSVSIYGYGTAAWPGLDLDMRFRSRSKARIPLLSSMVEHIRDELISIAVSGTLREPHVGLSSLPGTSRLIRRGMGEAPTEQERHLDQIERRSERDPRRSPAPAPAPVAPK